MSLLITCDWCGKEIEPGKPYVRLHADAHGGRNTWDSGYVGHYHSGQARSCYVAVHDALQVAHSWGPTLETIPTATRQAIAAKRRKHNRPEGQA